MQWLIDIIAEKVIAEIGIPPTLINRGDPPFPDFNAAFFTKDGAWHDLDLSGIVPTNASAVLMAIEAMAFAAAVKVVLRKKGNINDINISQITSQTSGIIVAGDFSCPIGSDGLLEYFINPQPWITINISVKGWWL